jgi:hypothetical protein
MCYWKQWRYVRTKVVRNLLALGTFKRQAILTALSSKSYWRLSRTLATQSGMTNEWLKRQPRADQRPRSVDEDPWLCLISLCASFFS